MESDTSSPPTVTLDNCEREAIHVPGAIQPHGMLLACDAASLEVLAASANCHSFLGRHAAELVGQPLAELLEPDSLAAVLEVHAMDARHPLLGCLVPVRTRLGQRLAAEVHEYNGVLFVEAGAQAEGEMQSLYDVLRGTYPALGSITETTDVATLLRHAAQHTAEVSGFDRVMIYRFDGDWNGAVVEECCRPGVAPMRGLHFPASDIPAQARAMYRTNLMRYIANVNYEPVPLQPALHGCTGAPFDLSHSVLRSVSPIHLQYLRNMGVTSTLTISLIVGGRLWGLIAGHHLSPSALKPLQRQVCGMVGLVTSAALASLESERAGQERLRTAQRVAHVLHEFQVPGRSLEAAALAAGPALCGLVQAQGGALWIGQRLLPFGDAPPGATLLTLSVLAQRLGQHLQDAAAPVCAWQQTSALGPIEGTARGGVLAAGFTADGSQGVFWLRPEQRETQWWGGNPSKPVEVESGPDGLQRLGPRHSFEAWLEVVEGGCKRWTDDELAAANAIRELRHVLDVRAVSERVARSEARFRSLVRMSSDAYWETDTSHRVIRITGGRLGARALEAVPTDEPLWASVQPEHGDVQGLQRLMDAGLSVRDMECTARLPDGQQMFLLLNAEPLRHMDGSLLGYRGTLADSTERRAAERARAERDAARRASEAKSRFLSHVSHELRTPLNGVLGFAQLLDLEGGLNETQRGRLTHILSAGQHLLHVVEDLLDLSAVAAGKLRLRITQVAIRPLLLDLLPILQQRANAMSVKLELHIAAELPQPHADADRLRQVMLNLVGNAIKYNRSGGRVEVHAFVIDPDAEARLRIEVRDNGNGIAPEHLPLIFVPFERLGQEAGTVQGTGIGLAISRELVSAMGGALMVHSELGVGSTFAFELPLAGARP